MGKVDRPRPASAALVRTGTLEGGLVGHAVGNCNALWLQRLEDCVKRSARSHCVLPTRPDAAFHRVAAGNGPSGRRPRERPWGRTGPRGAAESGDSTTGLTSRTAVWNRNLKTDNELSRILADGARSTAPGPAQPADWPPVVSTRMREAKWSRDHRWPLCAVVCTACPARIRLKP